MSSTSSGRVAYIGVDHQLHLIGPEGEDHRQLSVPLPRSTGAWTLYQRVEEGFSWPTWSPDGNAIAVFAAEIEDGNGAPVRLLTLDLDGVRQVEWAEFRGMTPLYAQWHPNGDAISVLLQEDDEMVLALCERERLGQVRALEVGVPLFFNWTLDGGRVLIHVGGKADPAGRLVARDPRGPGEDVLFADSPGSFCAPIFPGGEAVYALSKGEGTSMVVVGDVEGKAHRVLLTRSGLVGLAPGPRGKPVFAVSQAPGGEGTPYRGIDLVHLPEGRVEALQAEDGFAFFWSPTGDWLLQAVIDPEGNCFRWNKVPVDGGPPIPLGSFWPTRDTLFYLNFFDQYAESHPIISPDGRWVTFAGYPAGGGQADLSSSPRIYVKDTWNPAEPAVERARGTMAVFSPR